MALHGNLNKIVIISLAIALFFSCNSEKKRPEEKVEKKTKNITISAPNFNADSAYDYIQQQVDFGPRVPNTQAHNECANYLTKKLQSFGLDVIVQETQVKSFNNEILNIKNIIGQYNIENKQRVLLCAHWDSRPFADQDTKDKTKPILGANDGASGVGVLLEIARQLSIKKPSIGIDIIFFDAEDYGQPSSDMMSAGTDTWCLGSQYWTKNLHVSNYKAEYGILLDMVGAPNAQFTQEAISMQYAPDIMRKVWSNAQKLGYGNFFINEQTYFVGTDDHKYINEIANIPCIDIIQYDRTTGSFNPRWHTHNDNMEGIDVYTLEAVGKTVLYTILTK